MKEDTWVRQQRVGVIHLVRAANGLAVFERFLNSYNCHQGGAGHDLVLLLKGFRSQKLAESYMEHARKTVVVGVDGRVFEPESWGESGTVRNEDQKNLMVADNQTRRYAEAALATRTMLAKLAWNTPS